MTGSCFLVINTLLYFDSSMANINIEVERLNRFLKGNFSEDDRAYLINIFCDKNKEEELEHIVKNQWYELLEDDQVENRNLDHILYRIHYELNTKGNRLKSKGILKSIIIWSSRIAAILILPLIIYTGILFCWKKNKSNLTWIELNAPAWTRVQFSLPDGSTGWLNSSSSLRYNSDFKTDRKVILDGEAFFNVKTNPARPFEVSTDEIIVTATGTKFNIASYKNENDVEVVLEEGSIQFKNMEMSCPLNINPKDLLVYNKSTNLYRTEKVKPEKYIAWTEGKLIFRNDPIDVIAQRLGRWYNVDVEVIGNNYSDVRLRATFVDENLEEVLYFLKRTLPIDYKILSGNLRNEDEIYAKKRIIITTKKKSKQ